MRNLGFRSPIKAALLYPMETALIFWMLVVSILFTIWPESLEHAPVSFEERGVVHHVWHYSLLVGAVISVAGLVVQSRRRTLWEILGLVLLASAVALNLIAVIADGVTDGVAPSLGGWDVALRFGILTGLILRIYILTAQPVVEVDVQVQATPGGK